MILALRMTKSLTMKLKKTIAWLLFIYISIACAECRKKNTTPDNPPAPGSVTIKDSVLVQGLQYPWEIIWGPDNYIWMTERGFGAWGSQVHDTCPSLLINRGANRNL